MNVRLLVAMSLVPLCTVFTSAAFAQESDPPETEQESDASQADERAESSEVEGEPGTAETDEEPGATETEEEPGATETEEETEVEEGGDGANESTDSDASDASSSTSEEEPAPLRNVVYTTAVGGGVSLGYGSLDDSATGGHGYVISNFGLEMSRIVSIVGGLGYQFRSGGKLIDESPQSIAIDSSLGTAHYLLVEVGARFTVLPDNEYSPRFSTLFQGQIELGVEEVNVYASDTAGRAFQEEISPWFVFEYGQPVMNTENADLLIGLRASQALASTYRSTGDNSFDLFQNPGGNLDGRLWFTQLGLWVGVEY